MIVFFIIKYYLLAAMAAAINKTINVGYIVARYNQHVSCKAFLIPCLEVVYDFKMMSWIKIRDWR